MDDVIIKFSQDSLWILNLCLGFIMFGIALDLKIDDFKRLFLFPKSAIVGIFSQFVVLPAATFVLILILNPHPALALGMILVAACPGGNISNFISHMAKANTALSVSLTGVSSILAIVFTPINFKLWSGLLPNNPMEAIALQLNFADMFETIMLLILIPLILGMLVGKYFPRLTEKVKKPIKILSLAIFGGFIVIAFASNIDAFKKYFHLVLLLVLLHNAVAFSLGYLLARFAKLNLPDVKTITIETGIQNSALGLILIFSFFNGNGGMALVAAWWGIWHIIAGIILGSLWSKKKFITKS